MVEVERVDYIRVPVTDIDTFATFNEAYVKAFGSHRPARSTVGIAGLVGTAVVEIEAWAFKPLG